MSEPALHPIRSHPSIASAPRDAPIEAHTAAGPSIMARTEQSDEEEAQHHSHLIWKRLRRDMPLPSPLHSHLML